MPDGNNNLTLAEIAVLEEQLKALDIQDESVRNLERIGEDVSDLRQQSKEARENIETLLKVYKPLAKE